MSGFTYCEFLSIDLLYDHLANQTERAGVCTIKKLDYFFFATEVVLKLLNVYYSHSKATVKKYRGHGLEC